MGKGKKKAGGNPAKGEKIFKNLCAVCHSLTVSIPMDLRIKIFVFSSLRSGFWIREIERVVKFELISLFSFRVTELDQLWQVSQEPTSPLRMDSHTRKSLDLCI
ncbi:MAG: hypothetical protein OIF50_12105 [Flavobacteriaceae bacterium]|nr:hypothetical protein [Flavobacteriaceae bacterium]